MTDQKITFGKKKRVLLIYTVALEYRIPFFSVLGEQVELTVSHSGQRMTDGCAGFNELILSCHRFWRFQFQKDLRGIIKEREFDAIIFFMDISWASTVLNFLFPPIRTRRIIWGLWRTGSLLPDIVRVWLAKKAEFNVFYSQGAARDFVRLGVPFRRISVANNTFRVVSPHRNESSVRDSIIVVGSFNARKRNDVTLSAFIASAAQSSIRLVFIGDGPEKEHIESIARQSSLASQIEFHAACHDEAILHAFYDRAICSVSNSQAGLSVLQSFAFGVPFVTSRDAISGGEIENIKHLENGWLTDGSQEGLTEALKSLIDNPDLASSLGRSALNYYRSFASIEHMVAGMMRAIVEN